MLLYLFKYLFELFILLILYGLHIVKALYKQKKHSRTSEILNPFSPLCYTVIHTADA